MNDQTTSLEKRVAALEQEVQDLKRSIANLDSARAVDQSKFKLKQSERPAKLKDGSSEEILSWVDKAYVLPRVATTSFILVIALALRTATDNGVIDQQIGSFLGVLYAFGLIVYGWFAYRESQIQAPVFTLWGTIVMCAVVVEAHRVFDTVPAELAYFALALTGAFNTITSRMQNVALPVFAGTLGMSFGAFAIDYPSPHFPYLTVIIVLANLFAAYATHLLRASWLRWLLLILTLFMIQIWDLKLAIYLGKLAPEHLDHTIRGFLPAIFLLGAAFACISLLGVLGRIQEKVSKFDISLPVINGVWIFVAGYYAIQNGLAEQSIFGWLGTLGGIVQLSIAWWLAHRKPGGSLGTTPFALGGAILLSLSAPLAFDHRLLATALIALLAIGIALVSQRVKNSGLRLSSYLLQIYASFSLVAQLWTTEGTKPSLVGALASGLMASIAFFHYYWSRKNTIAISADSFLARLNKKDRGASLLLIAALFSGFFTLRVGLYQSLDFLHIATHQAFRGAQSVLINACAASLFAISLSRRDKELRNVAVVITVIGAAKVFLLDMVQIKGMPLMASIFSFGLMAAFASVVLGRWNKMVSADKNQN
ncbi:MAG: DUF2339 domain-containing protein [Deltaproteobacteria bacterium]|jgi:hypothetical protein|nr:DUF2339 domain-containing protein [Deltaproteobacteria bacterium]MBW2505280.1 DUF2339 domain-containing protein [Deltaproteobacteria bacterium]MBW2519088.1 DUF2339 domain-containing protein [Deltaproteobacteria bacterium]